MSGGKGPGTGNPARLPLPALFLSRVSGQLGGETEAFLAETEKPSVRGLRMNLLRPGWETPFRDAGERIPWCEGGWELAAESPAGITIAHEAGAFYLQEPGAMIPAAVMNARPGERILDLCAAPGGKSTQMGASMKGEGLLVCNEPVPQRAAVLSRNTERMGIRNAIVTCAWPEQLAEKWPDGFDGVMADAPCSGEGMFRREPESRREWSAEKAMGCATRQRQILREAAKLVRPGGRLVYATCTFNPAENEEQIRDFLNAFPEFEPEGFLLPGIDGREGSFTCWPHRTRGEGQFVALLRRAGNGTARKTDGRAAFRTDRETEKCWHAAMLNLPAPNACFGHTLIRADEIPDLTGIRVMRLGLHLAEIRGKNLIPDHAAALAGAAENMQRTELGADDALRYMAGETIPGEACGWTVMTFRSLVLGWGKGSEGRIRNHYPKGLRNGKLII